MQLWTWSSALQAVRGPSTELVVKAAGTDDVTREARGALSSIAVGGRNGN